MTRAELLAVSKPISFNGEMVQAILEERKSVTRRVVKPRYRDDEAGFHVITTMSGEFVRVEKVDENESGIFADGTERYVNPPYCPGDILWVRETFSPVGVKPIRYLYKCFCPEAEGLPVRWRPSRYMPKEAARIFLRVKSVRVERLQEIDNAGAKAEGVTAETDNSGKMHRSLFVRLWNSTIEPSKLPLYGWDANPWVWVIEFERVLADG